MKELSFKKICCSFAAVNKQSLGFKTKAEKLKVSFGLWETVMSIAHIF